MATPINWHMKFKFVVEIDGVQRAHFMSCSEIKATVETVEYREGGRLHPHKSPGLVSFAPVTLARGVCEDKDLYNWFKDCVDSAAGTGMKVPDLFRNVEIVQMDRDGSEMERTILYDCYCKEFSAGDWDNKANEHRMETVVIEYDYFEKLAA